MTAASIQDAYSEISLRVARAAGRVGRDPKSITIVAVSKTVGLDEVAEAIRIGIADFGENRVPEFKRKIEAFPQARWHFIGTLQTNKVKDVVGRAHLIHSVDNLKLLHKIDAVANRLDVVQPLLLQVNVSGEESKHGFAPEEIRQVLLEARSLAHIKVKGLMTMAPIGSEETTRSVFYGLSKLRDENADLDGDNIGLSELSMGMSGDFEVAIEEGATLIRVGRSLFVQQ